MKFGIITVTVVLLLGCLPLSAQQNLPSGVALIDSLTELSEAQFNVDQHKITTWSDSLKARIDVVHRLDSLELISKIDSLRNLDLPTLPYVQKLDSLLAKKDALLGEVENKKQELLGKTRSKLESWRNTVAEKLGLDNINTDKLAVNDLPGADLAHQLPDLPQVTSRLSQKGSLFCYWLKKKKETVAPFFMQVVILLVCN